MSDSEVILVNVSVEVDDEPITVVGDTVTFKEGLGERSVTAASKGGNPVIIISDDLTTRIGEVMFEMPSTIESMNVSRDFSNRGIGRVVRMSGTTTDGKRMGRTLTQAVMVNDPEKQVQNEGTLKVEFKGAALVTS